LNRRLIAKSIPGKKGNTIQNRSFMKKLLVILILLCSNYLCFAKNSASYAIIKGRMNKYRQGEVVLYKALEGNRAKLATVQNSEDKEFSFMVPVQEEGLYYLSDQTGWWYIRLYLKQGDEIELNFTYPGSYQIVKGSAENKLMYEWFKTVSAVTIPAFNRADSVTYRSFYPKVKELLPAGATFKKKITTPNRKFNALLRQIVDIDVEYAALRFSFTPRRLYPSGEDQTSFLKQFVVPQKYCNTQLLNLGEANDLFGLLSNAAYMVNPEGGKRDGVNLSQTCGLLCNDTIKGAYIVSRFDRYKSYDQLQSEIVPLEKYLVTAEQKKKYQEKLKQFDQKLTKGNPGYNFSYPDTSGKTVSLIDLKGKVVLMDMWATWCKPCLGEIPHLKKLEEEFKGKDVVFVGVSFDEEKDKEKWKKFIQEEELAGVQLLASGFKNKLGDFYKINGIPRFIVLDREGKIVSVDAPRPSQPELKILLNEVLAGQTSQL
jgi:thiol-disulfide isomerase/thioredoxin